LHDHFQNAQIKLDGKVDMLGISFKPDGFFPFIKSPVSAFRNSFLGAGEVGFHRMNSVRERLMEAPDAVSRISILEDEFFSLIEFNYHTTEIFHLIFKDLHQDGIPVRLSEFCQQNNLSIRKLERLFNKHVGLSPKTYATVHRFQSSLNQLRRGGFTKLSDIAYINGYSDQMHFIKEFKRFAGKTPTGFLSSGDSLMHIGSLRQEYA
jgi:AraC-like DNA-binding protein